MCGGLLLCGLVLMGCREDEQDRLITFEKGRYPGEVERTTATPEAVQALNERAMTQQF
jgi:hypothetical protein